ncbi:MAG: cupredoxin domain-containing protein [Polyangiaceae bacterium]
MKAFEKATRIALFALVNFSVMATAMSMTGCKDSAADDTKSGPIAITADDKGFTPASVTLKKGAPAQLIFTRTTDATCATEVVFPDLKITKKLPLNTPTAVDIPTDAPRSLSFACGMGMFKGAVVVR